MDLSKTTDALIKDLKPLVFAPPVTHVYNPLEYARKPYDRYLRRFSTSPKEIILLGMNPGPWGMAQTGIPFGEVDIAKNWLGMEAPVASPANTHPKKPVQGFSCTRSEISGFRLWGWAKARYGSPERFFSRFFVANYCPLLFIEATGRNRTPDKIRKTERLPLFEACDRALRRTVIYLKPRYVVGVGEFATTRARSVLTNMDVTIGRINHPSPANPRANKGWEALVTKELFEMGVPL